MAIDMPAGVDLAAPEPIDAGSAALLAGPLAGAMRLHTVQLQDVPDSQALGAWLAARGIDTASWGTGDSKSVAKLWKELELAEASLEVWLRSDGSEQVVRAAHVLRGKVRSVSNNGDFLCNTWQQLPDGRVRQRNTLLTEKLTLAELPLEEEQLHRVCARAVSEELHQIVEESYVLGTATSSSEATVSVLNEQFRDYVVEVECSKSYPGLLTVYHMYTVDIVCSGLPDVDFKTLEFTEQGADACRQLKYVHAWTWVSDSTPTCHAEASTASSPCSVRSSQQPCSEHPEWIQFFQRAEMVSCN